MKKANLQPIQNISILNEEGDISVKYSPVSVVGYCNGCTNRNITNVFEIHLRSLSFRLCTCCKNKLLKEL